MPIRTNRGRAAVYRRLWNWPLRSPKHLVIAVVAVAVVGTGIGLGLPRLIRGPQPPAASPPSSTQPVGFGGSQSRATDTGSAQGSQAATPTATRLSPADSRTSSAPDPAALDVAAKWGAAWVAHQGVAKEQWLAALEPYTTEEFLRAKMSTVDTENIAATGVTGPPVVKSSFTGSVTVDLPTNATTLSVTLIKTLNGWRVASYDEEA